MLSQFLRDLASQKLRTTLTVLGIAWGTVAVAVLMAFGVGLEKQTMKNMKGMGDGIVVLFGGTTTAAYQGYPDGRPIRLQLRDVKMLRERIPAISSASPEYRVSNVLARFDTLSTTPTITGVWPEYGDMRFIIPEAGGRFLNELDEQQRRRVVVLGDDVKRLVFGDREALHQQVMLGSMPFTVIGVMEPKTQNSSYGSRDSYRVFIPASTFESVFGGRFLTNIVYKPVVAGSSAAVGEQVRQVMGRRYTFDPADRDALGMWDTNDTMAMFDTMFLAIRLFLAIVGAFTLIVGGIGVANIMYIVVRERTREIGIKRALGARRVSILGQFLLEATLLVAFGALVGFGLSVGIVELAAMLPIEEAVGIPELSARVLLQTVALLGVVAVLAGIFPARKAARLAPVDALRFGA
jgi:putative ABC transport system permease protein